MPKPKSMSLAANQEASEDLELDPILWGLLEKLPEPGAIWDKPERVKWLQLFQLTLEMLYPDAEPTATNTPPGPKAMQPAQG